LLGVQEVPGSNPGGPTKFFKELQASINPKIPSGVQTESKRSPNSILLRWVACEVPAQNAAHGSCSPHNGLRGMGTMGSIASFPNLSDFSSLIQSAQAAHVCARVRDVAPVVSGWQ